MELEQILLLFAGGLGGGILSAMVGGAALITYPVLIAAGLPPVTATAVNLFALTPGNFLAALSDRTQLPPRDRGFVGLVAASIAGAGCGAVLLLLTPERTFALLVPLLLGFATVLFGFSSRISAWLRARAQAKRPGPHHWGNSIAVLVPVSVYGGYFGGGVGVLLLAVLSIGTGGDYRSANVTKNLVTSLNSVTASLIFVVQGIVPWRPTLAMMAGGIVGSLLGATFARVLPPAIARFLVVIMGAVLTAVFADRFWF